MLVILAERIVGGHRHLVIVRDLLVLEIGSHCLASGLGAVGEVVDLADAGIDGLSVILIGNARATVHDERGEGALADLIEHIKGKVRLALVQAVDRTKRDSQDVAAGCRDKLVGLIGVGVDGACLLGSAALDLCTGISAAR